MDAPLGEEGLNSDGFPDGKVYRDIRDLLRQTRRSPQPCTERLEDPLPSRRNKALKKGSDGTEKWYRCSGTA